MNPTLKLNTSTHQPQNYLFLRTAFLLASLALLVYLLKWSIERTCSCCSRSKLDRCHRTTRCRSWTDSLTSTATVSTHNILCTCWGDSVKQRVDVDYYWVAYGQTQSRSAFSLFVLFFLFFLVFFFFFCVGKSLACHSPGKWCLCA